MHPASPSRTVRVCAVIALVFGLLTIASGAQALFGSPAQQAAMGNYVGFVLWFNFAAGFVYVLDALGLWRGAIWARSLAWAIAGATALVFLAFGVHIVMGGAYEGRTVAAMTLRLLVWLGIAWLARPRQMATSP